MSRKKYNVAVVGATGMVGKEMLKVLEERKFPVNKIIPLASERSAGTKVDFNDQEVPVEVLNSDSFKDVQIALFSAGAKVSEKYAPLAVKAGAVGIDNTSHFRMHPDVPLIVPEVNRHKIPTAGIIANPNCSTAQMLVALKPIYDAVGIKRIVVSTYQSVSGTGKEAVDELEQQVIDILQIKPIKTKVYPHQIAFNVLPQIDEFVDNGYTKEEMKMVNETKKIFGDDSILVTATTVRVPVFYCHSESVNVETKKKITAAEVRKLLAKAENVIVSDDPQKRIYPMPVTSVGKNETFVGRIREDISIPNGIEMFVVSDNLRKGAAFNAVQIAEEVIQKWES
jgi:aspartate-semialdehyde dehydrogenase